MSSRITNVFSNNKKKLITFVTGGDPSFETSKIIIKTIIESGADIIEIGMPFLIQWQMDQQFNYQA